MITKTQYTVACAWYDAHEGHVNRLLVSAGDSYPPGREDMRDPALWKPEHWLWFLCHVEEMRSELWEKEKSEDT